jgi:hypothetical protein
MSPGMRGYGNCGDVEPLYHVCAHTRRICPGRSTPQRNRLEPVWCGAGRSAKLLLTSVIGLITLPPSCRSFPVSSFAVRDQEPAHETREGFSSRSSSNHDGPRCLVSFPCEASAPNPCVILSHRLDSAPSVLECLEPSGFWCVDWGRAAIGIQGPPTTCGCCLADERGISCLQVATPMLPVCVRQAVAT